MNMPRCRLEKSEMLTALIVSLFFLFPTSVYATPPTSPVQLQLLKTEVLATLRPEKGVFNVSARVQVHQEISKVTLIVRTTKMGTLGRRESKAQDYTLKGLRKDEEQQIDIKIPAEPQDGIYRVEVALHREHRGKVGVVSKEAFIQVVENGQPRLMTPKELRRTQVTRKKRAFQDALAKKPNQPDIRLLMDRTVPVPADLKKFIKPYSGPKQKRAKGSGIPALINPYILDKTKREKPQEGHSLSKPGIAPIPGPPPAQLALSGQVVFEDWYTDDLGNPVLTPLAQVTIDIIGVTPVEDEILDSTVTDENGDWSVNLDPAYEGDDLYYAVVLSNEGITIQDELGRMYGWSSATRTGAETVDFGEETLTYNVEAAGVFAVLNKGWNHIVTEGGQNPGLVVVEYPGSYTHWGEDEILYVELADIDGPDTILHEYGHALMQNAFGGIVVSPGGPHSLDDPMQDPGLAYAEGWASAFALSVCPDGIYDWHEEADEGPNEWPTCTTQNDVGGFSFENLYLPDIYLGEENESRVGAAINDLLDLTNDDNSPGGTAYEAYGRNSYEDDNRNDRISLATIYRDHMWNFLHNDFKSFYGFLLGDLTGTTKTLAEDILHFNWMETLLGSPIACVASKVAMGLSSDYANVLDGLRGFRDKVMKPLRVGRRWIQSYYSHSPEMAILLIENSEARKAGQVIVEHFSQIGRILKEPKGLEQLSKSDEAVLPSRVIGAIKKISKMINAKGSEELKQKLSEAREFLKMFKGMSVSQAVRHVSTMKKARSGKGMFVIQPMKFAPGSQKVNWELIKKNLPSED
ncbi:MAG: hypothetical protein NPIRA02_42480 [Nitrospirales bacterium]|nr:MAG: hypothetical protein NPIRA02_42480 [Nitrospirales bacterium]